MLKVWIICYILTLALEHRTIFKEYEHSVRPLYQVLILLTIVFILAPVAAVFAMIEFGERQAKR